MWAQELWRTGFVAPWHVGSSRTRARTRVPCIGRQTLNHCATREAPEFFLKPQRIKAAVDSLAWWSVLVSHGRIHLSIRPEKSETAPPTAEQGGGVAKGLGSVERAFRGQGHHSH